MKAFNILLAVLLLISVVSTPVYADGWMWDTPLIQTWYHQGTTHTVDTVLGYGLLLAAGETPTYKSTDWVGNRTIYYSWRVWLINKHGNETELSSGLMANTSRTTISEGLQTATWTPPLTTVNSGYDAIKLNFYIGANGSSFMAMATFVSDVLETTQIYNYTWTFRTYTRRSDGSTSTRGWIYYGDLDYQTRIENIQLKQLSPWEKQMNKLNQGDFAQFIVLPWTNLIGNLFYGMALFFVCITTYLRYDDIRIVLLLVWIFGGTGGIATLLIPAIGLHVAWLFIALALAVTLYLVIK